MSSQRREDEEEEHFDPNEALTEVFIWVIIPIISCFVAEVLYRQPLYNMTNDNVP